MRNKKGSFSEGVKKVSGKIDILVYFVQVYLVVGWRAPVYRPTTTSTSSP
jgi:hypothetical protein